MWILSDIGYLNSQDSDCEMLEHIENLAEGRAHNDLHSLLSNEVSDAEDFRAMKLHSELGKETKDSEKKRNAKLQK